MSATGQLETAATKHQVYIGRLAAGYDKDYQVIFDELARDTRRLLAGELTSFERARLNNVLQQLDELIDGQMQLYSDQFKDDMAELAEYEAGFATRMVQSVVTVQLTDIAPERIKAMATKSKMVLVSGKNIDKYTIDGMLKQYQKAISDTAKADIRATINNGVTQGLPASTITRNVANRVSFSMSKGVIRQWADANVRTAAAHISQEALNEVVRANSALFEYEKYTAVLDGKTTVLCAGLDGNRVKVGEGAYPPLHFNCRTRRLPYIPDQYAIIKKSERASINGPVDSRTTYNSWLKQQSKEFQDDVLGVERAKLFRSGKITLDKFVDEKGRTLTLKELAAKEGITLE